MFSFMDTWTRTQLLLFGLGCLLAAYLLARWYMHYYQASRRRELMQRHEK